MALKYLPQHLLPLPIRSGFETRFGLEVNTLARLLFRLQFYNSATLQADIAPVLNEACLSPLSAEVAICQPLDPNPECINASFNALRLLLSSERQVYTEELDYKVRHGELHPAEAKAIRRQLSGIAVRDLAGALHETAMATISSLSSGLQATMAENDALRWQLAALNLQLNSNATKSRD